VTLKGVGSSGSILGVGGECNWGEREHQLHGSISEKINLIVKKGKYSLCAIARDQSRTEGMLKNANNIKKLVETRCGFGEKPREEVAIDFPF